MRLYKCAISTGMITRRVLLLLYVLGYLCAAGKPSQNEPHSACYTGSIYQLYKSGKSQSESLTRCQQDGGNLASVKTKTIHCILVDLIEEGGVTKAYIGASQYSSSGETSWLFDNSLLRDGYDNRENTANYAEGCVFFLKKSNGKYDCSIINGKNVDGYICQIESNCSSETGLSENQKECISAHSTKPTTTTPDETSMTTDNPVTSTKTVASTELTTTTTPTATATKEVTATSSAETTTPAPARSTIKWTGASTTDTTAITHNPTTTTDETIFSISTMTLMTTSIQTKIITTLGAIEMPVTSAPITATSWLATTNLPASATGSTSTASTSASPINGIPTATPKSLTTTLTNTATILTAPPKLTTAATIPITTTDTALTTMTSSPTTIEASNITTQSPRATNLASTSLLTALTTSTTTTSVLTNTAKITMITSSSQAASSTIKPTKKNRTTSKNDKTSPATSSFYQPLLVSTKISTETSFFTGNTASTLGLISNKFTHTSAKSTVVADEHTVSATQANYISTKSMHAITGSTTTSQSRKSAPTPPQTESANNAGNADHLFGLDNVGGTYVAITGSVLLLASIACLMCLLKRFITKRKIKKMEDLEDEGVTEERSVENGELHNSIFREPTINNDDQTDSSLPGVASKQQAGIPPGSLVQPDIVCNKGEHVALNNSRKRSKSFEIHSLGENQITDITPTNVEIFVTDSQPRSSTSSLLDILSVQPDRTGNQIGGGRRKIRLLPKPSYVIEKFKAAAGKVSKRLI